MSGAAGIGGIHGVLYAFFDAHERLDRAAMRSQVQHCIDAGAAGLVALGLATEVAKLTASERRAVVAWMAEDAAGRLPFGVTIFGGSVAEQSAEARAAERDGAAWLILQPPIVGHFGASEYVDFFARVAASTKLPVAVQNAPAYLGRGIGAAEFNALLDRQPNMTLLKAEGSAAETRELIAATGGRLRVFNGRGGLELTDSLRAGCAGMILAPELLDHAVTIEAQFRAGNEDAAEAGYRSILPAIVFVMQSLESMICYGKRLFGARVGLAVHDRAPALRPTRFGLQIVDRLAGSLGEWPTVTRD